jgi:hypothetical protein
LAAARRKAGWFFAWFTFFQGDQFDSGFPARNRRSWMGLAVWRRTAIIWTQRFVPFLVAAKQLCFAAMAPLGNSMLASCDSGKTFKSRVACDLFAR